jgi:ADP-ribose pyrophosphatase YjhB (NUDIX family)
MKNIRNSTKAIIIENKKVLMIKNIDNNGFWYLLSGGGQHHKETLIQALKRECREEANIDVEVGELLFIREYIGEHHEFAESDGESHQIEFMFSGKIIGNRHPQKGRAPDIYQKDIEWLEIKKINDYRIYPKILKKILPKTKKKFPIYLGDIN